LDRSLPENIEKILTALEEKKALDVQVLDVRGLVSYTDYLVICSGTSNPHVNALVTHVRDSFSKKEGPVYVNPSRDDSWWILDFVDAVVHVFKEEARAFYDLERLWSDAKSLDR
jgi:ribosome-associated protein